MRAGKRRRQTRWRISGKARLSRSTCRLSGRSRFRDPKPWPITAVLAALAAFELIDWPVAVVIAAGHLLASNHHNKLLEELGEAIEDAE